MDVDQNVAYMQSILRGAALQKYKAVLVECKQSSKDLAGDKCTLGALKKLSTDDFWNWAKKYGIMYDGYAYLGIDKCVEFEKEVWLELGKCMWRKHQSVHQDHLENFSNDI